MGVRRSSSCSLPPLQEDPGCCCLSTLEDIKMQSGILYASVARGTVVLAEQADVGGNATLVALRILRSLPEYDTKISYTQDRHLFHAVVSQGIAFLCMAEESFGRRIPFAFLEDVKERFFAAHGSSAPSAVAYQLSTDFGPVLRERMHFYSSDKSADTINRVRGELASVKDIMVENIDKVLDRGERIELLVNKTDHLEAEAFVFRRDARRVKRQFWWKNTRAMVLLGLLVLLVAYVIVAVFCSPTFRC